MINRSVFWVISFKIETWEGKFNLSTEAAVGAVKDVSLSLSHSWRRDIIGIVFHSQFRVESVFLGIVHKKSLQ